jgi:hypothetical protein
MARKQDIGYDQSATDGVGGEVVYDGAGQATGGDQAPIDHATAADPRQRLGGRPAGR